LRGDHLDVAGDPSLKPLPCFGDFLRGELQAFRRDHLLRARRMQIEQRAIHIRGDLLAEIARPHVRLARHRLLFGLPPFAAEAVQNGQRDLHGELPRSDGIRQANAAQSVVRFDV